MPRQPRYFLPDIPQHVIARGVDRQATFFSPDDYALFKDALLTNASYFGAAIYAYVLMTNHVNLLLTPFEKRSIPQILQGLGRDFVQRINRQYGRTDTLWQGRCKASLVQDDLYLLHCQQYIELNPVRAGMVSDPVGYPHSSYRRNALGTEDPIVSPHAVYENLERNDKARHERYRALFETAEKGVEPINQNNSVRPLFLGDRRQRFRLFRQGECRHKPLQFSFRPG